jgi:hypothetical protein
MTRRVLVVSAMLFVVAVFCLSNTSYVLQLSAQERQPHCFVEENSTILTRFFGAGKSKFIRSDGSNVGNVDITQLRSDFIKATLRQHPQTSRDGEFEIQYEIRDSLEKRSNYIVYSVLKYPISGYVINSDRSGNSVLRVNWRRPDGGHKKLSLNYSQQFDLAEIFSDLRCIINMLEVGSNGY